MADKRVGINVQLKLDSEAFIRKVDGLSETFKPIEVPVKLKSLGLNTGTGVRVKADIDTASLSNSLKSAFSDATARLGDDIGERVGKSIEKIKPNAFSGIIGAIASPFQQIATGALEGVGREMSAKLGQGLAKGIEKQTAPVIGSFELLGEKLITTAAPRLGNTIGGRVAKSLFGTASVKQAQQDFKRFLTSTVGESNALIESESAKARQGKFLETKRSLAQGELGKNLATALGGEEQRQRRAAKVQASLSEIIPEEKQASLELAKVKSEQQGRLSGGLIPFASEEELEKVASEAQFAIDKATLKLTEISKKRVIYEQLLQEIISEPSRAVELLRKVGADTSNVEEIDKTITASYQKQASLGKRLASNTKNLQETLRQSRKEVRELQAKSKQLLEDAKVALQLGDEAGARSILEQRKAVEKQILGTKKIVIPGIKQDIASSVEAVGDVTSDFAKKRSDLASKLKQEQISLARRSLSVGQSADVATSRAVTRSVVTPTVIAPVKEEKKVEAPVNPKLYEEIVRQVARKSGINIKTEDIPKLFPTDRIKASASYLSERNAIKIKTSDYEKLSSGNIGKELTELIVHELRHAIQYNFGQDLSGKSIDFLTPNEQQLQRIKPGIEISTLHGSVNKNTQEEKDLVRQTEIDAYTFADKYYEEIYSYIKGLSKAPAPSLKTKLTQRQKDLNAARLKSQEQLFESLTAENKAALEQLTVPQLKAIARSTGVSGYSNKKVGELRQILQQQVNPEELAFRIPIFSKVNPQVQQDAEDLKKLSAPQLRQEISETGRYFNQNIKSAAKKKNDPEQAATLRLILDGIAEARKVYASALAQDLDQEQRDLLKAAIARLGKQRIAAQSSLTSITSISSPQKESAKLPQSVFDIGLSKVGKKQSNQLRTAQEEQKKATENFQKIFAEVVKLSGIDPSSVADKVPTVSFLHGIGKGSGQYSARGNRVALGMDVRKKLATGKIPLNDIDTIAHEIRHAIQSDFGNISTANAEAGISAIPLLSANKKSQKRGAIASVEDYQRQYKESYKVDAPKEVVKAVMALEEDAYTFAAKAANEIRKNLKKVLAQDVLFLPRKTVVQPDILPKEILTPELSKSNLSFDFAKKLHDERAKFLAPSFAKSADPQGERRSLSFADAKARRDERQSRKDLSFTGARARHDERVWKNSPLSFANAQFRHDERAGSSPDTESRIKQLLKNAESANAQTTKLTQQINAQVLTGLISADAATQKISALLRASQAKQDKSAQRQNQATVRSSEASFRQAQQALKQLETQVDGQVAQIESRTRYNEQLAQRKQSDRLRSYGIDQAAPVDIVEQRPQARIPSVGKVFNNIKSEFQDFRTSGSRKQAQALNQQAQAILVDLDSQIAIGKASVTESKVLQKQIAENEKRIQQIIAKVRASKEGRIPPLTAGDLQRMSGQLNQLGTQVDADKLRVAELDPQIARAKRLQPVANDLRGASSQSGVIASQKNISDKDLGRLNQYNQQVRESLKLLGQTPGGGGGGGFGGFITDLNLKMPGLLKNVFSLVKGFLAFQVVSMVQQQLQQLAVTAFQTSLRFEALEKSLNFATGGEGAEGLAFVRKEVDRLSLPLETSIKGFTGLAAAARGTSIEGARTQKIFTAIAQAARVYNLTSEQTEGALLAVQQIISKGTVQAEELRGQLGERIPGAVQIFARAMGVSTAELNKLLEGGKVGLDDLSKFADQLATETAGGVDGATKTAAASLQRLQNSFTDLNRQIGDAVTPAAIAVFDALSKSLDFTQKNAKVVQSIFAALALTAVVALIPSITALGGALMTFATVTLPLVAKTMLATVAANPVLLASLAALAVGLIVAEDAAKALANALNGVSQAQIDATDKDVGFDVKYNKALAQLNKQIPLTKEQINELTTGLDDQAKRGVNTASVTELLKNQLLKLQTQAEATAAAQDALNKAVTESEAAFKKGKGMADIYKSRGDLSTSLARARGLIADDKVKDEEYESEQKHNINMSALNNARMIDIKNQLAESERLQKAGKKGLEAKQEKELREELLTVEKDFNQAQINLVKNDAERTKELRERRLKDFDEAQSITESKQKAGNITEEKLLQDRLVIQQQKGEEQLADIAVRREKLNQLKNPDKEGLEALAVEEAKANADIKEAQKTAFDQRIALSQKRAEQELAIAQASKSKGLITETEFNQQQYDIRNKYLDDQLAVLKIKSQFTAKTDIDGQNLIKTEEAKILQQRTEARKTFLNDQLALLEREQEKARDILVLATTEREKEVQKLINSGAINQEEASSAILQSKREEIAGDLELENKKLAELEAAPRFDDPTEEEARQTKIRASKKQTSQLQLQLLQNERQQQEANYNRYAKAVDTVNQAIANRATVATQSFNKELLANSALEKSLTLQNQLLDAQKNLRSAISSYVDAEFQVLQETSKGEREKKQLAEAAANARLQATIQQAKFEAQSLDLQIKQNEQAQRRLEIENAIAQIKNRADVAKAQAEVAKVDRNTNATDQDKEAARLGVVAAVAEGEGLKQQEFFLAQQRQSNDSLNGLRRQTQQLQSDASIGRAEFEAANAIANKGERRRALRNLRDRANFRVFGTSDQGEASNRLDSFNNANRGQALTPLEQYRASQVQNRVAPALPQIELPKVMPMLDKTVSSLGTAVDSLVQLVQQKLSTPATVTIATPINNYFPTTPNPRDIAASTTQATRKEIYDLGMLLQRK